MAESHRQLAKLIDLVNATPPQRQNWLAEALPTLSHEALDHLQREHEAAIDRRYPDDPGSLLNSSYRHGQQLKRELQRFMDHAHARLTRAQVNYVEAVRNEVLAYQRGVIADGAYAARRDATSQRRGDALAEAIDTSLAFDPQLQADLVRQRFDLAARREMAFLEAEIAMQRERHTAAIERARRLLDRPHELNLKAHELLESLLRYQMSLNDRALRNPAIADRMRMMGMGLTTIMTSVQHLITVLNQSGETPPDPDWLRQQADELLARAMEQLKQWEQATYQEHDL